MLSISVRDVIVVDSEGGHFDEALREAEDRLTFIMIALAGGRVVLFNYSCSGAFAGFVYTLR